MHAEAFIAKICPVEFPLRRAHLVDLYIDRIIQIGLAAMPFKAVEPCLKSSQEVPTKNTLRDLV